MWRLAFVVTDVACTRHIEDDLEDAPARDASGEIIEHDCDPLTQTGCNVGEKCSWLHDQLMPAVAHIGCAPDGTAAVDAPCAYGLPPMGWDNCVKGTVCEGGVCKQICDEAGGAPMCDQKHSCQIYEGFLGPPGMEAAGVCDPTCDPLDDNFFGSSTRAGSTCAAGEGCYGFWNNAPRSRFSCASAPPHGVSPPPPGSDALFHRAPCTSMSGCENGNMQPYLNGCASGYMPMISDDLTGTSSYTCLAFCKPADCYLGHCGTSNENMIGAAPHRCSNADAAGTFDGDPDGDHCVFAWWFELQPNGMVLHSQYDDIVGICIDHLHVHLYDPAHTALTSTPWPACDTLPLSAASTNCYGASGSDPGDTSGCLAQDFGCVSTVTGMIPRHRFALPRPPYHRLMR